MTTPLDRQLDCHIEIRPPAWWQEVAREVRGKLGLDDKVFPLPIIPVTEDVKVSVSFWGAYVTVMRIRKVVVEEKIGF